MLSGVMLLWFLLTAMAVIFVAWDIQSTPESPVLKAGFVLLTCYTGPFGAFLYVLGCREPLPGLHEQVRAAHKPGWFEVIAGKSVLAFRREDEGEVPSAKCFGFVQSYDEKPRRRLWELMKSQGLQENQQVVFMSDGGQNVRRVQDYLHPQSEHLIDWFHIAMRLTVLQQQIKALKEERPETGADLSKRLESVKHLLWHGNTEEALERLSDLLVGLSLIQARSSVAKKVADGLNEFETYISNNREFIPNFGERRCQGETISTAFVESTINQVVSRRFVKKQQMQWTLRGAHLLLQTRTKVLNDDLDEVFRRWYPKFRPQPQTQKPERKAA